jgi:hypothetical protein
MLQYFMKKNHCNVIFEKKLQLFPTYNWSQMDKHTNTNNAILDQLKLIKQIINLYFHIKIVKPCS